MFPLLAGCHAGRFVQEFHTISPASNAIFQPTVSLWGDEFAERARTINLFGKGRIFPFNLSIQSARADQIRRKSTLLRSPLTLSPSLLIQSNCNLFLSWIDSQKNVERAGGPANLFVARLMGSAAVAEGAVFRYAQYKKAEGPR